MRISSHLSGTVPPVKRRAIVGVIAVVSAIVLANFSGEAAKRGQQTKRGGPEKKDSALSLRERIAHNTGGLEAAAMVDGFYIFEEIHTPKGAPNDLKELWDLADSVVVGTVLENVCELNADGRSITTRYTVKPERVIRGNVRSDVDLSVVLPGGKVTFAQGTWAQINTPGYLKPGNGNRLLLFLTRIDQNRFVPTAGQLGVYNLSQTIRPFMMTSGAFRTPLARRVVAENLTAEDLIAKVALLAERASKQ